MYIHARIGYDNWRMVTVMDRAIVAEVRAANEAAVMLLTLAVGDYGYAAAELASTDVAYCKPQTAMALAVIGSSAIKTLAQAFNVEPAEIIQAAGLSAAEYVIALENGEVDE